jgi:hypothetical protein
MVDKFALKPIAIGYANYGFFSRQDYNLATDYPGRMPGAAGVLLYKARSGNGAGGTSLDSKKDLNWQERAVFPGSLPLPNGKIMMYYDDNNTPYLIKFRGTIGGNGKTFNLYADILGEFGLMGADNSFSVPEILVSSTEFSTVQGDDFTMNGSFDIEQSPDCKSVFIMPTASFDYTFRLLGNAQTRNKAAILRVDISGIPEENAVNNGLTFNQSTFKTTAQCSSPNTTEIITDSSQLTTAQQGVVNGAITETTGNRKAEESIRYAYFDNSNNPHFYGFSAERTTYNVVVKGQEDNVIEMASPCYEDIRNIHLNGAIVETRTTSSCNYYNESDALPVDAWADEGLYTWNEGTTSFTNPFYSKGSLNLYYKGVWQDETSGVDHEWIFGCIDTNVDDEYTTCPQPTLYSSAGAYTLNNIESRFIRMTTFDPRASTQPDPVQLSTTVHSGYGTATVSNLYNSNLAYDHVNQVIVEFNNIWNQGSFQQVPVGFVSSDTVFY